jgi:hypothetical protein
MLDCGMQPVSNRFLFAPDLHEYHYLFQLGYCQRCGLVQLVNPPPLVEVKPRFAWIRYSEPEGHLDQLVDLLSQLPGINAQADFCGVSHFEDSTLQRLQQRGFTTCRLVLDEDLGVCSTFSVIETLQRYLIHKNIKRIMQDRGQPRVIIVRDILEHAYAPLQFMQALRTLVQPEGYIVFEVPDYSQTFMRGDYSSLWEEHITYFTPYTFVRTLEQAGFSVHTLKTYPYDTQNYLVAIVRVADVTVEPMPDALLLEQKRAQYYADQFTLTRERYRQVLLNYRQQGGIALMGAGHLACHFINLLGVSDLIDFVVDDHPQKIGMRMPGSQLPILSSQALDEKNIHLCLLSLSQESERKVLANKHALRARGMKFASIFPTSEYALIPYQAQAYELD